MKYPILYVLLLTSIVACKKDNSSKVTEANNPQSIAPNGFNFNTIKNVNLNVRLLSNTNEPISNVPVTFHNAINGNQLLKSITDADGNINADLNIASYIEQIIVKTDFVGLNNEVLSFVENNKLNLIIGGPKGLEGNFIVPAVIKSAVSTRKSQSVKTFAAKYSYLGEYEDSGKPKYLTAEPGVVSKELLDHINASIPSTVDVRKNHPEYIADNAKQTLDLVKDGEVSLTFITESAEYTNAVGYCSYPTNNPPKSESEIQEIKVAFPNASLKGSDGGLISGDRVSLGKFKAGTTVAFMMLSNAWDATNKAVKTDGVKYYSDKSFNPESANDLKNHTVLLHYAKEDLFVLGIEDINREQKDVGCDHDFNDAVFYAECYPKDAISKVGVVSLDKPEDTDGDGVTDQFDEYPTDPKKAYNNYFPSKDSWGTLAFEDNWPLKGDYDMNDLGINYRYTYVTNAKNEAVEMTADYKVITALAFFHNGFGVELPFDPSIIASTKGQVVSSNYIKINANGTEAGQTNAVIIPFDDQKAVKEVVSVNIRFIRPQKANLLKDAPYNPFLISDGRRSHEIHLPGKTPTKLADSALFGYQDDRSNPTVGKYYIGVNNWPWALQFTEPFNYPAEGKAVNDAFGKFGAWAASGGTEFADWYK